MNEIVSAYDQPIDFVVGFAGAGKSTHLAANVNEKTLVLTPTHRAARVLMSKGVQNVYTIHSVLGLVPTINQEFRRGQRMQRLQRIGNTDLKGIDHVVIDEFSMIPVKIADLLLSVLPAKTRVTMYGDPYQLPPVDGEAIDPECYTDTIKELTTQHRSKAPRSTEAFMRFMKYIKDGKQKDLTLKPIAGTDLCKEQNWVESFNPATDRILAYTNKRVLELNAQVAQHLDLPDEIYYNEDILINDMLGQMVVSDYNRRAYPTCMTKGHMMEGAKFEEASGKATADIAKWSTDLSMYEQASVHIDDETYLIYYDTNHYHNSQMLKDEVEKYQMLLVDTHQIADDTNLAQWCKENRGAQYVRERGRAWSNYLSHQNYVFSVRRPFATTVHKSQGSEFPVVYIDQEDMKKSIRNGYYDTYARLMYVAMSRAIEKVVLI